MMNTPPVNIGITGHRPGGLMPGNPNAWNTWHPDTLDFYRRLSEAVTEAVRDIADRYSSTHVIGHSGMALGADTVFAELMTTQVSPFPLTQAGYTTALVAHVPFPGQEQRWSKPDQTRYRQLCEQASTVNVYAPGYSPSAFTERNRGLVDSVNHLIAVMSPTTHRSTGTAHTARYALTNGVPVYYINPLNL